MLIGFPHRLMFVLAVVFIGILSGTSIFAQDQVSFSHDILPILSDRCFHCHGPDPGHRKAGLRLDLEAEAKRDRDGLKVVAAGDLTGSDLWQRLITEDVDEMMPPPDSHRKALSEAEKQLIRRWILAGAHWGKHWSFASPVRPALNGAKAHPVDHFVRQRLAREGLAPAPPAPLKVQLRRLSFGLTGLPPTPEEVRAFVENNDPSAWGKEVDRLLASPHHGERLAMWWLDAARYSDTDGFQGDAERTNWPWRDWVVAAFNRNQPFDAFTIEQFAGDLLPQATPSQILATCFHRNHMTNGEGGRDPEESRIDYVIDRVNTTGTVWLGLTLGCAQCHTHKFDPIDHQDYYRLFAFFNSIDEDGKAGAKAVPYLDYESPLAPRAVEEMAASVAALQPIETAARASANQRFDAWLTQRLQSLPEDYSAWKHAKPLSVKSTEGTEFLVTDDAIVQATGPSPNQDDYQISVGAAGLPQRITGWRLEVFPHADHTGGKLSRGKDGEFILTNVKLHVRRKGQSQVRDIEINSAVADYQREAKGRNYGLIKDTLDDDPRNGWTTESGDPLKPHAAVFELKEPLVLAPEEELVFALFHRSTGGDANIGRFRLSTTSEAGETVRSVGISPLEEAAKKKGGIDEALKKRLFAQFLEDDSDYQSALNRLNEANRQLAEAKKAAKTKVMVLAERSEPRPTHVLERGVWDAKGAVVQPGVIPAILPGPEDPFQTRLDLAKWLVDPGNPLTARVTVNHLWQLLFGQGLVRSPEDFGLQGELPTHPELLDWLAVELVESGWNLRHILRLIATSETYRQSSDVSPALLERDPANRLLARAPRFRLPAWMIRDQALRASGLLNPALGGPPVKPWQPEGVWEEIFMGRYTYQPSIGPAQYRRTLYAYWRRSSAPAFLFDNAQRRVCEVRMNLTNTPLHALTLLNDTGMLEAARALADSVAVSPAPSSALDLLAMRILSRELDSPEKTVLNRQWMSTLAHFEANVPGALRFTTVGQQPAPSPEQAPVIATWMTLASTMLNLDEAMTHE